MPRTDALLLEEIGLLSADGGPYAEEADLKVGLFTEGPETANPTTTADFTLPSSGNYIPVVPLAISQPNLRLDGRRTYTLSGMQWGGDADQLPITFKGCYLVKTSAPTVVLAWKFFDEPVVFLNTANAMQLTFRISQRNDPADIETVVVNG